MLKIKATIAQKILECIHTISPDVDMAASDIAGWLEYPPDVSMGDLAFPCFRLSKTLRRAPVQIVSAIAEKLNGGCEYIDHAENVNGYLNMTLSSAALTAHVLPEILEKGDKYGAPTFGEGKTVVLDYSSPTVAKPFHIGHLGTTVIGHSLKKLHEFAGYKCVGINYLGDWGTQFGKLIVAYHRWGNKEMIEQGGVDKLVELYVKVNNAISGNAEQGIEPDPALADEAKSSTS